MTKSEKIRISIRRKHIQDGTAIPLDGYKDGELLYSNQFPFQREELGFNSKNSLTAAKKNRKLKYQGIEPKYGCGGVIWVISKYTQSEAHKDAIRKSKDIIGVVAPDGTIYDSSEEAGNAVGKSSSTIRRWCREGKNGYTYKTRR